MKPYSLLIFCLLTFHGVMGSASKKNIKMNDQILTIEINVACSPDRAWEYFFNNTLLESWLTVKADVEEKVGGKYELFWTPEASDLSDNSTYGCSVLALNRPYYFNIEWKGNAQQKSFMNTVQPLTNVSVFFIPLNPNETKIVLVHTGWRQGDDWDQARLYFKRGWTEVFNKLQTAIQQK